MKVIPLLRVRVLFVALFVLPLAVVEPSSSGLGGGAFWLLHRSYDGFETMVEAREAAPRAATHDMFLDKKRDVVKGRSTSTALAAGMIFLRNGAVPPVGTIINQPERARTLTVLAERGADGFYQGAVAKQLLDGVKKTGGIWSLQDLAEYKVLERKPVYGR